MGWLVPATAIEAGSAGLFDRPDGRDWQEPVESFNPCSRPFAPEISGHNRVVRQLFGLPEPDNLLI